MTDQKLTIPIDSIEKDFQDFIQPDSNKRIIFSGPFGIGKTYFLDKFFKKREKEYLPIFLRPVNYSLLSNEDVFKLVKYDILLQLIHLNEFEFDEIENISKAEYSKFFLKKNGFLIIRNLLKLIPKIQTAIEGIEKLEELMKVYKSGVEEMEQATDLKMLFNFQNEFEDNFLLEYDNISQYISQKLDEIVDAKSNGNKPEKVLVIDDLDRLDPEHIFRLFNVFSAHFDQVNYQSNDHEKQDNKFGFDKIIFVCDIENIRKIFAHKYGEGVDFSGYIDKFYSTRIYQLFHNGIFENYIYPYLEREFFRNYNLGTDFYFFIKVLLKLLFIGNEFNIRDIERIKNLHLSNITLNEKWKFPEVNMVKLNAPENALLDGLPLCKALYVLISHFGSSTVLRNKIHSSYETYTTTENQMNNHMFHTYIADLILFADSKKHKFGIEDNNNVYTYNEIPYRIEKNFEKLNFREGPMWYRVDLTKQNQKVNYELFMKALAEASIIILDTGVLNI